MLHWAQVEREMGWDVVCNKQSHHFHHHWGIIVIKITITIVVKSWSLSPPADDPSLLMTMLPTICFTCCLLPNASSFLLSRIILPKCCPGKLLLPICWQHRILFPTFHFAVAPLSTFPASWTGWPDHHHQHCKKATLWRKIGPKMVQIYIKLCRCR